MKKALTALAAALLLASPAYAVDEHHPEQQAAQAPEKTVPQMQENAKKMQSQLEQLAAAETAEERQKLLAEHMQTMRENMMLGQRMAMADNAGCPMMGMMGGPGIMGPGMMGMMGGMGMMGRGGMMGPAAGDDVMMDRMRQMEKRMDMMQMMMERQMGGPGNTTPQGR